MPVFWLLLRPLANCSAFSAEKSWPSSQLVIFDLVGWPPMTQLNLKSDLKSGSSSWMADSKSLILREMSPASSAGDDAGVADLSEASASTGAYTEGIDTGPPSVPP